MLYAELSCEVAVAIECTTISPRTWIYPYLSDQDKAVATTRLCDAKNAATPIARLEVHPIEMTSMPELQNAARIQSRTMY